MILIGNLLSAVASVFLGLSCVINDKKKAYHCQALESAFLMLSSVFFCAWVRMVTLAPTVLRNELVAFDKYKKYYTVIFTAVAVISGLLVNREGPMGLFPIMLTVQLTVCNYTCKTLFSTKISFLVNVLGWSVYSFMIRDYAYGVSTLAIAAAAVDSLIRYRKDAAKEAAKAAVKEGARSCFQWIHPL